MADKQPDRITVFDTLFTNNHICMLKVLLPLLPPSLQGNIAVYIKYQELQYTMQYFRKSILHHGLLPKELTGTEKADINSVFDDMLPYCTPQEKQSFTKMRNMYQSFQNMKEMMEMLETMKELFPEGFDGTGGFGGFGNAANSGEAGNTGSFGSFNPEMLSALGSMFGGQGMDISQMVDMFRAFQGST